MNVQVLRAVVLVSLLGSALCAISSEDCDSLNANLPFPLFMLQDGMTFCLFIDYIPSEVYNLWFVSVELKNTCNCYLAIARS